MTTADKMYNSQLLSTACKQLHNLCCRKDITVLDRKGGFFLLHRDMSHRDMTISEVQRHICRPIKTVSIKTLQASIEKYFIFLSNVPEFCFICWQGVSLMSSRVYYICKKI